MQVIEADIPDVKLIVPRRHRDPRGLFVEVYRADRLTEAGMRDVFIQDNHSISRQRGVVRGLHYQIPPLGQAKLVRVIRGSVLDVAVDLRQGSPSFGRHVAAVLSAENWTQMYIPIGFAHGFVTLESDTEVLYKVSAPWSPEHERGIRWNDPALEIDWQTSPALAVLSDRDQALPMLAEVTDFF